MENEKLPISIQRFMTRFVRRRRRLSVLQFSGFAVSGFIVWMLIICGIDRIVALSGGLRFLSLIVGCVSFVLLLARPILLFLRSRFDWMAAAADLEKRQPRFDQRLITVISQHISLHRGSPELVTSLTAQVCEELAEGDVIKLAPTKGAATSLFVAFVLLVGTLLLSLNSSFGLSQLAVRFFLPFSKAPAVTTTRIHVRPGSIDIVEGQPFTAKAIAERLGNSPLTFHVSSDRITWNALMMSPISPAEHEFKIASVDRDLNYFVTGGDATSETYQVKVLHAPAVAAFRIRYNYPAYTRRPSLTVSNNDGLIEAPVGTEAIVGIRSTEPLSSAELSVDGNTVPLISAGSVLEAEAKLIVKKDEPYKVTMLSQNGVRGRGPESTAIRATPDRKPLIRLIDPSDDLRLSPHDLLPAQYEAMDDYGLSAITIQVQMNSAAPWALPIKLRTDPRHQEGLYNLDLAAIKPAIGDIVSFWFQAVDSSGQLSISEVRHILISPRSIDITAQQRIDELSNALQLVQTLAIEIDSTSRALDEASNQSDHFSELFLASSSRANRHLTAAGETCVLLRQALLRAILRSASSEQSTALANLVDSATICDSAYEDIVDSRNEGADVARQFRQRLNDAGDSLQKLNEWLTILHDGEQAAAIIADRENLSVAGNQPAPKDKLSADRREQIQSRARKDISDAVTGLKLNPDSGDLDVQLHQRVTESDRLTKAQRQIDFVGASREWATRLGKATDWPAIFGRRLAAAAQAEAIRTDANLIRARDLQLSGKAAEKLSTADSSFDSAEIQRLFPLAMEALKREHELYARRNDVRPPDEISDIRTKAAKAREQMQRWAGDDPEDANARAVAEANAAATERLYGKATELDQSRMTGTTKPFAQEAVNQSMKTAEKIDKFGDEQNSLRQETAIARDDQAKALSTRQEELAGKISDVKNEIGQAPIELTNGESVDAFRNEEDPGWRDEQASSLSKVQEQLAAMPGQLSAVEAKYGESRRLIRETVSAEKAMASVTVEARPIAERALDAARQAEDEGRRNLIEASNPVDPARAEEISIELSKFTPDSETAVTVVNEQLLPSLRALKQNLDGDNAITVTRTMDDVRRAIEAVQEQLAAEQHDLMERDPLVAAKWYAKSAANALARTPPDMKSARKNQQDASAALARAWDVSIHSAATGRLSQLPSMASIFSLLPVRGGGGAVRSSNLSGDTFSHLPMDWGRLQTRDGTEMSAPIHEIDPPGYEDSLRVYFETLARPVGGKK